MELIIECNTLYNHEYIYKYISGDKDLAEFIINKLNNKNLQWIDNININNSIIQIINHFYEYQGSFIENNEQITKSNLIIQYNTI